MAKVSLNIIKNWFKTGLKPTQQQFWDTWDSFFHKDDKIPVESVEGLNALIAAKADKQVLDIHISDPDAHGISGKVDKENGKGLSQENFTTALRTKLEGLNNFDPTDLLNKLEPEIVEISGQDVYYMEWTEQRADRFGSYPTLLVKQYNGLSWSLQPVTIDDVRDGDGDLEGFSIPLGNIQSQIIIKL